jgi:IS5 family transposase
MAPDRLLRCCVMKHLKGWSFRDLERELRSNLVYRRFTHFDAEATPDFTTFSRAFALLSPAVTEEIHQRVVGLACEQGVAQGQKLRTDTTKQRYPTDSSLLGDGIRVLSRSLQRIARECKNGAVEVVHHARAVKHRLLEISRAAKCLTEANQQRMRDSYQRRPPLRGGCLSLKLSQGSTASRCGVGSKAQRGPAAKAVSSLERSCPITSMALALAIV